MGKVMRRSLSVIAVAVAVCVAVAACALVTDPDKSGTVSAEEALLRERYPQYFDLDTSQGLDVYVWQMARNSWSFGLLPHTADLREQFDSDVMDLIGATAEEMRQILSAYSVESKDIHIIPWQNPLSSYISGPWIITEDKSQEEKMAEYLETVRQMLFEGQSG